LSYKLLFKQSFTSFTIKNNNLTYNSLKNTAQRVDAAWAQVENQFQRRADLIPNLVSVTQAYARRQERELVMLLQNSRQTYLQADSPNEKIAAMAQITQALDQFQHYSVQNPQLQSSQVFINLQYELAGTENRIAVERMRYNQAVEAYNQKVESFPNSLFSVVLGFQPKAFYQAQKTTAPVINPDVMK
jgi:LemA protein